MLSKNKLLERKIIIWKKNLMKKIKTNDKFEID